MKKKKSAIEQNKTLFVSTVVILAITAIAISIGVIMIISSGQSIKVFNVAGVAMEPTLRDGKRVKAGMLKGGDKYQPNRGDIIVFQNPKSNVKNYIIERVIGLPGERVTVNDCVLKIYNSEYPDGFDPYSTLGSVANSEACVAGDGTDVTIPDDKVFVMGDNREGGHSMDSRDGGGRASLGLIPLKNVVGVI